MSQLVRCLIPAAALVAALLVVRTSATVDAQAGDAQAGQTPPATPPPQAAPPQGAGAPGAPPPQGGAAPAETGGGRAGRGNPTAALFTETCAPCHGIDLAGGRAPSLFNERLLSTNDDDALHRKIMERSQSQRTAHQG